MAGEEKADIGAAAQHSTEQLWEWHRTAMDLFAIDSGHTIETPRWADLSPRSQQVFKSATGDVVMGLFLVLTTLPEVRIE